jgi:6-phosphogluconolactonase
VSTRIAGIMRPFDVVILGMGADGHTASWFPGADGLGAALDEKAPDIVAVRAKQSLITGEHIDRLTLSLRAIRDARVIILLISGNEKRRAFERACGEGGVDEMPVRAIIRARPDMWVCWAP